jgi:DNA invertase Pin-like site-specific DNA recombinase
LSNSERLSNLTLPKFSDAGFSGASLNRPSLRKMRAFITRGSIDVVIVYDLSRLTRSVANNTILESEFARHGASLRTAV